VEKPDIRRGKRTQGSIQCLVHQPEDAKQDVWVQCGIDQVDLNTQQHYERQWPLIQSDNAPINKLLFLRPLPIFAAGAIMSPPGV
jgi:hypothetical protein